MSIIATILLLLVVALGLSSVFKIIGLPDLVGAIIAGIIVGPAVFGIISPTPELASISSLALFFIILQIGIESSSDIFSKNFSYILVFAITSFLVPFILMAAGSYYIFKVPYLEAVSTSLAVSIPSISITSVLLVKSGLIKSEDGMRLLGGVAMSDVLAFIILVSFHRSLFTILIVSSSLAIFVLALYFLDNYLKSKSEHLIFRLDGIMNSEGEAVIFAVIILMGLAVSYFFEYLGITFVMGAFFSGLIIHQNSVGESTYGILKRTFQRINSSFFIPLFFSISGVDLAAISLSIFPYMLFLILLTAAVGGFAAYQFSKRFMKTTSPSISLGIFGGRGAVGIIIASIALSDGFLSDKYYSSAVFATIIMAIAFSFVFERAMKRHTIESHAPEASE